MMKSKKHLLLVFCLLLVIPAIVLAQFGRSKGLGKVTRLSGQVTLSRKGQAKEVSGFGLQLQLGDTIKTGSNSKAKIALSTGDEIFLAPLAEITINKYNLKKKSSKIKGFIISTLGKIRARVARRKTRRFRIKTANAVIGVKGTDFVVDYSNKETRVATLSGLVNMASSLNNKDIDIPAGKMSTVDVTGSIMPLSEIAGDIMDGVEIMGKKMTDEDILGKKIKY